MYLRECSVRVRSCRREDPLPHLILPTTRLSEIRDRRELSMDGLAIKPAVIQVNHRFLCIFLTAELHTKIKLHFNNNTNIIWVSSG